MTFIKGRSGNPSGSVKSRPWKAALLRAIERSTHGKVDYSALDEAAEALLAGAISGDVAAIKELADRLDGKAEQFIDMTVSKTPEARVYPAGLPAPETIDHEPQLPTPSEAVDSVH